MRWGRLLADPVDVYLGLGSNVGDRIGHLRRAVEALTTPGETEVVAVSPVYETEAHVRPGAPSQRDHLNAVAHVRSRLHPFSWLIDYAWPSETAAGRARPPTRADLDLAPWLDDEADRLHDDASWSPRPLDIDLLLWGDSQIDTRPHIKRGALMLSLAVPHPRIAERRFVLQPLADLAPDLVVPGTGQTVAALLAATPDRSRVVRTDLALF